MAARTRGGGRRNPDRPDPLRGLVDCACGSSYPVVRHDGGQAPSRSTRMQPCPDGMTKKIWDSETWLAPIEAQIAGHPARRRHGRRRRRRPRRARTQPPAAGRSSRSSSTVAASSGDAFAAGRISERDLIDEMRQAQGQRPPPRAMPIAARPSTSIRAIDYIRNFAASWAKAQPADARPSLHPVRLRGDRRPRRGVRLASG